MTTSGFISPENVSYSLKFDDDTTANINKIVIAKYSFEGKLLKVFTPLESQTLLSFKLDNDNNLSIITYTNSDRDFVSGLTLTKGISITNLTPNYQLNYSSNIIERYAGDEELIIKDHHVAPNGKVFVGGDIYDSLWIDGDLHTPTHNGDLYIMGLDSLGKYEWHYNTTIGYGFAEVYGIVANDTAIYLCGNAADYVKIGGFLTVNKESNWPVPFAARFDNNGKVVWLNNAYSEARSEVFGCNLTNNGGVIMTGVARGKLYADDYITNNINSAEKPFFLAFTPSGEATNTFHSLISYGSEFELSFAVAMDQQDRVYIAGTFTDRMYMNKEKVEPIGGITDVFVAMLNPKFLGTKESSTRSDLIIFPNPANDRLNIQLPVNLDYESYTLEILGVNGQLLSARSNLSKSDIQSISVEDLPHGLYLLRLTTQAGNIYTNRFSKQ